MQRRLRTLPHRSRPPSLHRVPHPGANLPIDGQGLTRKRESSHGRTQRRIGLDFLVILRYRRRFEQRREPLVAGEHRIGRAESRGFVQAGPDKIPRRVRVTGLWQIGRIAVNNGLWPMSVVLFSIVEGSGYLRSAG